MTTSHAHAHSAVPKLNDSFEATRLHLKATSAAHTASSGTGDSILRTLVALVIVVAVIYALTWIVRRVKGGPRHATAGEGLERLASMTLSSGKSVALVRVGAELHLLGVAENAVTSLRRFTEDEALELGLPIVPPGARTAPRPTSSVVTDATFAAPDMSRANRRDAFPAPREFLADHLPLSGTLDSLRRFTQR